LLIGVFTLEEGDIALITTKLGKGVHDIGRYITSINDLFKFSKKKGGVPLFSFYCLFGFNVYSIF